MSEDVEHPERQGEAQRTGVLLVSRGRAAALAPEETDEVAELLGAEQRYITAYASLEHGQPSIPQSLQQLHKAGCRTVIVVPMLVPSDPAAVRWITTVLERWQLANPEPSPRLVVTGPLAKQAEFRQAVLTAMRAAEPSQGIQATPAALLDPPGWSHIPPHRYHVLACQGARCTALGAGELWQQLRALLAEHRLNAGHGRVLVTRTGCLYPCTLGPVLVVYPDGVWYRVPDAYALRRIVERHLVGGKVVEEYQQTPGQHKE